MTIMGVRRTVFWGGHTILWTGQKAISTLSIPKFLFNLAIVCLKFHKCQNLGPGKCIVLPIDPDAHDDDNVCNKPRTRYNNLAIYL